MLNSVTLVGRLVENPTLKSFATGRYVTTLRLAVQRPFKNAAGEYDTDFITSTVWDIAAKNVCEYCMKGDLVAICGRLQVRKQEIPTLEGEIKVNKVYYFIDVFGERVIYLAKSGKNIKDFSDEESLNPPFDDIVEE